MPNIPYNKPRQGLRTKQKQNTNLKDYNSKAWRTLSTQHRRSNPLCEICKSKGKVKAGRHVDHIKPIKKGGDLLNPANLQTLCISCHSSKTIKEQRDNADD